MYMIFTPKEYGANYERRAMSAPPWHVPGGRKYWPA